MNDASKAEIVIGILVLSLIIPLISLNMSFNPSLWSFLLILVWAFIGLGMSLHPRIRHYHNALNEWGETYRYEKEPAIVEAS